MAKSETKWTVITGSTGGIGGEIVNILASRGVAMILVNRSQKKAESQLAQLLATYPDIQLELVTADFLDATDIIAATEKIQALPGRIDTLYNNAGVLTSEKIMSKQGFESQFAVNTLAPYLLIRQLRSKMTRESGESQAVIINFSSSAITRLKKLELQNLCDPEKVGGLMSTYAQTKLAVTALAPALADDLMTDHILIRAIDPGPTKSAMTTSGNSAMPKLLTWLAPLLFRPADKQALKVVESSAPDALDQSTGIYVANKKVRKLPDSIKSQATQKDLVTMLDSLIQAF